MGKPELLYIVSAKSRHWASFGLFFGPSLVGQNRENPGLRQSYVIILRFSGLQLLRRVLFMAKRILYGLILIFICFVTSCNNDNGTGGNNLPPTISSMVPNQVSLGENDITGHINGTNLSGVTSVAFGGGISIQNFHATSSTEIE